MCGLEGNKEFSFGDMSDVRFDKVLDFFTVRRFQRIENTQHQAAEDVMNEGGRLIVIIL